MKKQMRRIDYARPACTGLITKMKFYMVRMLQKNLGRQDPEYTDYKYWNDSKTLDDEQMRTAFEYLQKHFSPVTARIESFGLAKTNPHREIMTCQGRDQ